MLHGRTHLHEFTRDDGSVAVIEYKLSPYYGGSGPTWNDPGSPPEGGEITDWEIDGGATRLSDAEAERAEHEIYNIPPDHFGDDEDWL